LTPRQARLKALKTEHGTKSLGEVTVGMAVGGMRGIPGLLWETSLLDADDGILFRGRSIPDLEATLPRADPAHNAGAPGEQPLPEGLLWLLLTGEVPTDAQRRALTAELTRRAGGTLGDGCLPSHVGAVLDALPPSAHPMTQLQAGVLALQPASKFSAAYAAGTMTKRDLWRPCLDDALDLIARLPALASRIYRRTYRPDLTGAATPVVTDGIDWAGALAQGMGVGADAGAVEMLRLYQTIHADHEGGNVSAHTAHVVGSALSDPYLSFSASMAGLAGPLHGLANQEVLLWLERASEELGGPSPDGTWDRAKLKKYCEDTLASGRVVPGFGHAVLRQTDPRYTCQRRFALKRMPDDPLFGLVSALYDIVPDVLRATGKVKNPWPNVDAHSGVLLRKYNIREAGFYTVLFGTSRAMGVLAQGAWSRALGLPIERPKSLTMEALATAAK